MSPFGHSRPGPAGCAARISLAALAGLLAGCAAPAGPTPTATPIPVALTATPLPTAAPAPTATPPAGPRFYGLDMIDSLHGWAWAFAPAAGVLLRTEDGGHTWADVGLQGLTPNPTLSFFLDSQAAWIQWYDPPSRTRGLLRTTDGGRSWEAFDEGQIPATSFRFADPADGWLAEVEAGSGVADYWLYETHDGGAAWAQIILIDPPGDLLPALYRGTIRLCHSCGDSLYYDPLRLVAAYGNLEADPGLDLRLAVSTDRGVTWQEASLPLPPGVASDGLAAPGPLAFFDELNGLLAVKVVSQSPIHPYQVLALYATADGGLTWIQLPEIVPEVDPAAAVQIVSPQDAFVACGGSLCATHDGGQTWQALASGLSFERSAAAAVLQFDFVSPSEGWALAAAESGGTILWQTTDGGTNWAPLAPQVLP